MIEELDGSAKPTPPSLTGNERVDGLLMDAFEITTRAHREVPDDAEEIVPPLNERLQELINTPSSHKRKRAQALHDLAISMVTLAADMFQRAGELHLMAHEQEQQAAAGTVTGEDEPASVAESDAAASK